MCFGVCACTCACAYAFACAQVWTFFLAPLAFWFASDTTFYFGHRFWYVQYAPRWPILATMLIRRLPAYARTCPSGDVGMHGSHAHAGLLLATTTTALHYSYIYTCMCSTHVHATRRCEAA